MLSEVGSSQINALDCWLLHLLLWQNIWVRSQRTLLALWLILIVVRFVLLVLGKFFAPWRRRRLLNEICASFRAIGQSLDRPWPADAIRMDDDILIAVP